MEQHLSYDTRKAAVVGNEISKDYSGTLQVCVLAKNSEGLIGRWFDSQCYDLPADFDDIKQRYTENYHLAYTMLSSKSRKSRNNYQKSTTSLGCAIKFDILLLFLGVLPFIFLI